ncbi:TetR/AcrR family transcriptional regulator [Nonomuraea sp. NPDC049152]|uniref:TetR/AcrR family transcriptional regulator n=1 Tax=Nonomuraea sp. NPDC049152 TaxID=3154350 RepID=UPI0033FA410F
MNSVPPRPAPVGRGKKVSVAVHAATLAELVERGYAALTVDGVAQRAGVHKTTVYRRWKDKESLVVDALSDQSAMDVPIPDTGSVETDLRELARSLVRMMTGPTGGALLAAMFSGGADVPGIAQARRQIFDDRFRRAEPVVVRAVERGQLPADTDPPQLLKALAAPVYFRLLVTGEPIDEGTADHAAEITLAAARAGVLGEGRS